MQYRDAFIFGDTITCEANHPQRGWGPYTARADDSEAFSRQLYTTIIAAGDAVPYVIPEPTTEQLAAQARAERNTLLAASDWTQVADAPFDQAAWATYRQALRDITAQAGFPEQISWPEAP